MENSGCIDGCIYNFSCCNNSQGGTCTCRKAAYIHIVDQRVAFGAPDFTLDIKQIIKENFKGVVISGGDVNSEEKAKAILASGLDLVYVGRPFISNPDLVEKLQNKTELVAPDMDTFYSPSEVGYTDY